MIQRVSLTIGQWTALREGGARIPPIWFSVVGGSMRPLIRAGCDKIMLVSVAPEDVKTGDIVLFPGRFQTADYCLHRVYRIDHDRVQTFGDGNSRPDGWVPRDRILGRVKFIRRGKHIIDCDDPKWRRRAVRWCSMWKVRPLLMLPHRVADLIERIMNKDKILG